jgi:hypothetical protein
MTNYDYDYTLDPDNRLTYVDVMITEYEDPAHPMYEEHEILVAIGDGIAVFDENFDVDHRIGFYFDNQEQYELAKTTILEYVGFKVLREIDEEDD